MMIKRLMKLMRLMGLMRLMRLMGLIGLMVLMGLQPVMAQDPTPPTTPTPAVTIGGNVYGGGNQGVVKGRTSVSVYSGDIQGNVFAGARMADVEKSAYVIIDGDNMSGDITINRVFGGNDIAGSIGISETPPEGWETGEVENPTSFNAFVKTTKEHENTKHIYIGQLFGGGNGDYEYTSNETTDPTATSTFTIKDDEGNILTETAEKKPELAKTYIDIHGGTFGYVFGGGNNVTVTDKTHICIDNESEITTKTDALDVNKYTRMSDLVAGNTISPESEKVDNRLMAMGLNLSTFRNDRLFIRVFGGNNKAEMNIRPEWHLEKGSIYNLYSGGNAGPMTHIAGILMEIPESSAIEVDNVFGGCRMADVLPLKSGTLANNDGTPSDKEDIHLEGYDFPDGFSARVLIDGGKIQNVYGGNDITGNVKGGTALGIHHYINGNVYGGGNGSYAYTDNPALEDDLIWGDFFYDVEGLMGTDATDWSFAATNQSFNNQLLSVKALNKYRPNVEQVTIRVKSNNADKPTIVGGAIYVGGNSASILETDNRDATIQLKLGSYVIADTVFLGNNGKNMVDPTPTGVLLKYAGNVQNQNLEDVDFSSLELANDNTRDSNGMTVFDHYMEGVTMRARPELVFDGEDPSDHATYVDYSSYIGSFYCGGNVGSMRNDGTTTIDFNHNVVIYNKLVGGCNTAYVPAQSSGDIQLNAEYDGGLLGIAGKDESGKNNPKLVLNLSHLNLQPMRWKVKRAGTTGADYNTKILDDENGNVIYLDAEGNDIEEYADNYKRTLEWNTVKFKTNDADPYIELPNLTGTDAKTDYRLLGGNIYGGCYESGHVNGDLVINLNGTIVERTGEHAVFDEVTAKDATGNETDILYDAESYVINTRHSGVILNEQGMDVLGAALNVFGGGYGKLSEVWGNTTINLNKGFTFQIFGGGEQGAIGKHTDRTPVTHEPIYDLEPGNGDSENYNTYINMHGNVAIESVSSTGEPLTGNGTPLTDTEKNDLAECIFIYGGGYEGLICGDTHVYLGNGRIFNSFAGSCNADIFGHTETYIGKGIADNGLGKGIANNMVQNAFPWVRDLTYGGNDLGGRILGSKSFKNDVTSSSLSKVYQYSESNGDPAVLTAGAYTEFTQGYADGIFGGHFGDYQYTSAIEDDSSTPEDESAGGGEYEAYKDNIPRLTNAFVNFKPNAGKTTSHINRIYGGTQGNESHSQRDRMQDRSYVLIDIPQNVEIFHNTEVFGAGDYSGIGMDIPRSDAEANEDGITAAAVVDLVRGKIKAAYGGSYQQGFTRRTIVNVPTGSTINASSIFGGAYGLVNDYPCDVYEANVNYNSEDARVSYVYGGNNNARRTLYGIVNINTPVHTLYQGSLSQGTVYGGGYGKDAWSQYTEVNLNPGAVVWEVYGGGYGGEVLNKMTAEAKARLNNWSLAIVGNGYGTNDDTEDHGGLLNPLAKKNALVTDYDMDENTRYNTNVHIHEGAEVNRYCYGGGYGMHAKYRCKEAYDSYTVGQVIDNNVFKTMTKVEKSHWIPVETFTSGNVSGTTYIDLLGGIVGADLYGAGTTGAVKNISREIGLDGTSGKELLDFTASSNVYIKGGKVRNAYGGGWEGAVGYHNGPLSDWDENNKNDLLGETHVYIGLPEEKMDAAITAYKAISGNEEKTDLEASFVVGDPTIERNVYGGGEGGPIIGTAYLDIYNGHIGYRFENKEYVEKLHDETHEDGIGLNRLKKSGNAFGGGYVANSNVDVSRIAIHGGIVRNGLYGGGEIGPIGRGTLQGGLHVYKYGETHVFMYGGQVKGDVFGGGRGFDNLDGDGYIHEEDKLGKDLSAKGYVFGTTDVQIHRGEVGTEEGLAEGYGNVFGGGNIGFVYGGRNDADEEPQASVKKNDEDGYYYTDNTYSTLTEDCRVAVNAYGVAKEDVSFTYAFMKGEVLSDEMQEKLKTILSPATFASRISNGMVTTEFTTTLNYKKGDFIHNRAMNTLADNDPRWNKIDQTGITIHNAIFAGGNVSAGSDQLYANEKTVFGNVTASIVDIFDKDLISVGDDGIGGLYGDGNLTLVDGYRELNITNYGTDYHHLRNDLSIDEYNALTKRQKAYYELKYKAKEAHTYTFRESTEPQTIGETYYPKGAKKSFTDAEWNALSSEQKAKWKDSKTVTYAAGEQISEKEYYLMDSEEKQKWEQWGFCTLFEGRMVNTIQRADFCGVFGSRVVLRGAQDRVINEADYTEYTINRVGELSLNQIHSNKYSGWTGDTQSHGNYFGIYNVVNYLGALTSDVDFHSDVRYTGENASSEYKETITLDENTYAYGTATYYQWKKANLLKRKRNNGTSVNQVALASGVWLEIVDEATEQYKNTTGEKIYGPITGVVELKLVNVTPDEGGGYVYAKNIHGVRSSSNDGQVTVALSNYGANSYKRWQYAPAGSDDKMQTSGNFIHPAKQIIDDCYPTSGAYFGSDAAPAHYWYIRGEYYVYDQYISAYTGSAQAYAKTVSIPLTITAESQGKLFLKSIDKNLYAFWNDDVDPKYLSKNDDNAIVVQGVTYKKNDIISYWDWSRLTTEEQGLFTSNETYVCTYPVTYNNIEYKQGDAFATIPADLYVCQQDFTKGSQEYHTGDAIEATTYNSFTEAEKLNCARVFNPSNALSHANGFVLSFDWDNPDIWNSYHQYGAGTAPDGTKQKVTFNEYSALDATQKDKYALSPTYKCDETNVYGQMTYAKGDIIEKKIYDYDGQITNDLNSYNASHTDQITDPRTNKASFDIAYVAKEECEFTIGTTKYVCVKGTCVSKAEWDTFGANQSYFDVGMFCTEMYVPEGKNKDYLYGEVYPQSEISSYPSDEKEAHFSPAYICTSEGEKSWGGGLFIAGQNYNAVNFSNLSKEERNHFTFNYDALDLLISENFDDSGKTNDHYSNTYWYDHHSGESPANPLYSKIQSIDYEAKYDGSGTDLGGTSIISKRLKSGSETEYDDLATHTDLQKGDILTNAVYESLPNEQYNYTPFVLRATDTDEYIYIALQEIKIGDNFYMPGNKIAAADVSKLSAGQSQQISISSLPNRPTGDAAKNYYFCTTAYTTTEVITDIYGTTYAAGSTIPIGTLITYEDEQAGTGSGYTISGYKDLVNLQKDFIINGKIPTETSTLYVSRETDIDQLSKERIFTVIYQYDYIESDEEKTSYEKIRERHIVNVHITFESGAPTIGTLLPPRTVIPGNVIGLNKPSVSKGAFDLLGGGWELYANADDAITHKNGMEYKSGTGKVYWYQDEYYVAYYAKSYLGKTYSNSVPLSVANYHRMDDVMNSTHLEEEETTSGDETTVTEREVHDYMYLDKAVKANKRNPKVYINSGNELKQFKQFYDDAKGGPDAVAYQKASFTSIPNGKNIEFILDGDPELTEPWTPVGDAPVGETKNCFEGNFHGDGHTISGLDNSLFDYVCGDIYNLGVTGSFTTAGVANHSGGKVVNTWTYTTGTPDNTSVYPIVGNDDGGTVINSYYFNDYKDDSGVSYRDTHKKPLQSFLNGEVAFNLNSHFLNKRYNIKGNKDNQDDWKEPYVDEFRYANKDFIYAGGNVPDTPEPRTQEDGTFKAVYPNDYIYFGQTLTYDFYSGDAAHQEHPTAISNSKRVYRAPGYYRNKDMKTVYYNQDARFKDTFTTSADGIYGAANTYDIHKRLTAIDFTGYNDYPRDTETPDAWKDGSSQEKFYAPLLDHWGINSFMKNGVTRNLLVYVDKDFDVSSYGVLTAALPEATLTMETTGYKRVAIPDDASNVTGHLVSLTGSGNEAQYITEDNHYLVDRHDFNAPIEYQLGDEKRMWYQRWPDKFVNLNSGWEGVSIPFEADLVSTQTKGEITHFYKKSGSDKFEENYDTGHEYWLREFNGVGSAPSGSPDGVLTAIMNYPAQASGNRTVTNTYLWDWYYNGRGPSQHDRNQDSYQTYYKTSRDYSGYPLLAKATPYIIGFPGDTYYEFDLSGQFTPQNTYTTTPGTIEKQTISFVSKPGVSIEVSDDEIAAKLPSVTKKYDSKDYTFTPSYLNDEYTADDANTFLLNSTGDSFEGVVVTDETPVVRKVAFRPYFTAKASTSSPAPRRIEFGMGRDTSFHPDVEEHHSGDSNGDGRLHITAEKGMIVVSSSLNESTTVRITTTTGVGIATFTIEPGQIVRTPVSMTGVYIINRQKLLVK